MLAFAAFSLFTFFRGQAEPVTDPARYPELRDRFAAHLTRQFPDDLPSDAALSYTPPAGQGGERLIVRFGADDQSRAGLISSWSRSALWNGSPNSPEAASHGVFSSALGDSLDTVYVFSSAPYRPNDWNHGEVSLAGVDAANSQVLYFAEVW